MSVGRPAVRRRSWCSDARAAALGAPLLAAVLAAAPASAAMLTRGPYLQLLTTHSVTVAWNTDVASACSRTIHALDGPAATIAGDTGTVCAIAVDGLVTGGRYAYVPNADGVPLGTESVFQADDPSAPVTMLVFGDSGEPGPSQTAVRDRMLATPANVIVHTGDMIYPAARPPTSTRYGATGGVVDALRTGSGRIPPLKAFEGPIFFTVVAETGLRIGEALALKPDDFDWDREEVRIERALSQRGHIDTPKAGYGRTVDLSRSPSAVAAVQGLLAARKGAKVVKLSPWLFSTASGKPYSQRKVLRDMKRVLTRAKLPLHFSLHCLRHTYAAQRIAAGENVYYVSRQLGHASTKLTLDTYGRWLRARSTVAHTVSGGSGDQAGAETVTKDTCSVGERA